SPVSPVSGSTSDVSRSVVGVGIGVVAAVAVEVGGGAVSPAAVAVGAVVVGPLVGSGNAARTITVGFSSSTDGRRGRASDSEDAAGSGAAWGGCAGATIGRTEDGPVPTAPTRIAFGSTLFISSESSAPGFT